MAATLEKLKTILARDYKVDPQTLRLDTPLEELGIDSLATAELLWTVEEEFGIELPADLVVLADIAAVVHYIDLVAAGQASAIDAPDTTPLARAQ